VLPVFVTIDPHRDTPEKLKVYLKGALFLSQRMASAQSGLMVGGVGVFLPDFHPRLVGLTGTEEQIKAVAKVC
jgi:cytochrome oxidase Cu insertion factor (SCO1/SenC/PrrC family)